MESEREGMEGGNGNARKIAPKCNIFGIDAPWGYRPVSYMFRKLFSRAKIASQIVCPYRLPFRNYLASKLTLLEKYSKIQNIWLFRGKPLGLPLRYTDNVCLADSMHLP